MLNIKNKKINIKHYKVCKNYDYCYVEMPEEDNKILKYNHGEKSMKHPFSIYVDLKCLLEKINTHNNFKKSSTAKNYNTSSGYSMFKQFSFDATKNKPDCYRGKDCVERFCEGLKEHATKIINYEKKRNDTINP